MTQERRVRIETRNGIKNSASLVLVLQELVFECEMKDIYLEKKTSPKHAENGIYEDISLEKRLKTGLLPNEMTLLM